MERDDEERLRQAVQRFVRGFGLLDEGQTPCGHPLSPAEAHLLQILLEQRGQTSTQGQLAAALGVDKSTLTRVVQRLAAHRRVTRYAHAEDGRARQVALTERGLELAKELERSSRHRFAALLETLPKARRSSVIGAFEQLADVVQGVAYAPIPRPRRRPVRPTRDRLRR